MKAKNVKRKMAARIADYDKLMASNTLDESQKKGYHKPGSQNQHKN